MIAIHDLRIGNWVYDGERTQFPMFVRTIGDDYVYLDFIGNESDIWESIPDELQGILITEDLLKQIGFTFNGYGIWNKAEHGRRISINVDSHFVAIESYKDKLCDSRCTCHGIMYLHQLQNLFWSIANVEFKIEL